MSDIVVSGAPQGTPEVAGDPHFLYLLRLADDNLVLAQRLGEWIARAHDLEEDIALANIGLDHLGVARTLLTRAGEVEGVGRDEDDLAFLRSERAFLNLLLVEQPNGDFAQTMVRQLFFDAYQLSLWDALSTSADPLLGGVAQKAHKEATYHFRHSSSWVLRLGDGTEESHRRTRSAVEALWRFTGEMFEADEIDEQAVRAGIGCDPRDLRGEWQQRIEPILEEATLALPRDPYQRTGGRRGFHTEHLGHLLGELQWMQRAYPGLVW